MPGADDQVTAPLRVFVLGATGTTGRAVVRALTRQGHHAVCLVRAPSSGHHGAAQGATAPEVRIGDPLDAASVRRDGLRGERFDAVVSCLASRTGAPDDAWAVDHRAHVQALAAAREAGVGHWVQVSAICVQRPRLAFQHAKLAFERELMASGLGYTIVRPTAFFKSLSGQVARVQAGRPFLVFGDGQLTACKPISDDDLARFVADCLNDPARRNRVLPIGGPGPAITPLMQAQALGRLLGRDVKVRHVSVRLLDAIVAVLALGGRLSPALARKAEFARIGRYYATESMLCWDEQARRYDADATPSTGHETLPDFYARLLRGEAQAGLGEHAAF